MKLKLEQGQIWKEADTYLRIVKWSREAIDYKAFTDLVARDGAVVGVTKKEFCRLIKGGELMTPENLTIATAAAAAAKNALPLDAASPPADSPADSPAETASAAS
jgi:hypothetical protein